MKISEVNGSQSADTVSSQTSQAQDAKKTSKTNQTTGNNPNTEKLEKKDPNKKDIKEGVDKLNEAVQTFHEELEFKLHKKSKRMMVKIVNTQNHEVIKEIPPKETLDMLGKIKEMVGLIIDKKI
ncbi:flagellar protein FlaG [Selenihalanaerobacter shriftii]|uniref:Flagellar protein FlaG n=1 Tax=Selenihalanaerobacter shriftii TaxID=142842 RepID=A0A1T4KLY1_9FIRM|nr:flagellar protein FlaG [Selenihalanaerobacter shriftii]SJZ43409.1 flagellar protein FlaG [Selenihalanaerobacter shriftii]